MNFFIILFLIVGSYIFIAWVFFTYVQTRIKNKYIKKVTKIIFIIFPFYIVIVWWVDVTNYNKGMHGIQWDFRKNKECNNIEKESKLYIKRNNPWLLQSDIIFIANTEILNSNKCLRLFLKSMSSYKSDVYLNIYENVDVQKNKLSNGKYKINAEGRKLIFKITKKSN